MAQAKKKKKFFDVEIPIIRKTTQLYGFDKSEINGKLIRYDLTRLIKGKGLILDAKIEMNGEEASAIAIGIKIMPNSIKYSVRKGTDYVEDSFVAEAKDSKILIKPLLVTRRKVSKRVKKAIREKAREEISNYIKDKTSQEIIDDVLKNKMQKPLSLTIKKIYPLSMCEIRFLKVIEFKENSEKETSQKKEEKETNVEKEKKE